MRQAREEDVQLDANGASWTIGCGVCHIILPDDKRIEDWSYDEQLIMFVCEKCAEQGD